MEKPKLPPEMVEVLTTSHFAYLCTTNRDNQPHITPMFFIFDDKTNDLYVTASSESKKMKNIHDNPKISLTIDVRDATNPFNNRGVMVQGKAVVHYAIDSLSAIDDENLIQVYFTFKNKYPVLKKVKSPVPDEYKKFSESLIRISPKKMVYWKGTNFIPVNFDERKNQQ